MPALTTLAMPTNATAALAALWQQAALPPALLACADLTGHAPVLPSSFALTTAAQASLGAAALAALQIGQLRGAPPQQVSVDRVGAAIGCTSHFALDGHAPQLWDALSGLYPCGDAQGAAGWLRVHANFAHHRDGVLALLGLPLDGSTSRADLARALLGHDALQFEQAAAQAGLVVAAVRSHADWQQHPQARWLADQPLLSWQRLDDATPQAWPALPAGARALHGLRVLDLTRILAGPVAARLLAGLGADVLMVNGPQLPNIGAIADLSQGKRSALVDLRSDSGRAQLRTLVSGAQVLLQGYRPGALAGLGFDAPALAALCPGIVVASLSAYGDGGPWGGRRGFDSLVQTTTGFNLDEAAAFGTAQPRAFPVQLLDHAAGHLLAFGIQVALARQAQQGGSWHVRLSLAGVGQWLRGLGRVADGPLAVMPPLAPWLLQQPSGFGKLETLRHALQFSATPFGFERPAMPPGSHPPRWD